MSENDNNDMNTQRLERLIRDAVGGGEHPDFSPPSWEAVEAYVAGTATPQQEETVLSAIEQSPVFARQLLDIIDDYRDWSEPSAGSSSSGDVSLWDRFSSTAWYVKLSPFAAAALVVLVLLFPGGVFERDHPRSDWRIAENRIGTNVLAADIPRSGSGDAAPSATAREAALAALPRAFTLNENKQLVLEENLPTVAASQPRTDFSITLSTEKGSITCTSSVIGYISDDLTDSQVWIVSLLDQSLRVMDQPSQTIVVEWPAAWGNAGALVVTARTDSGYVAGSVALFSFETPIVP